MEGISDFYLTELLVTGLHIKKKCRVDVEHYALYLIISDVKSGKIELTSRTTA